MRHSLQSHIVYLEKLIQEVGDRLTHPGLAPEEVEDLQLQLFSAQGALEHYREAYALELSASGSEPPHRSGDGKSGGNSPFPEKGTSGEARGRRNALEMGIRKRRSRGNCIAIVSGVSAPRAKTNTRTRERVGRDRAA